MHGCTRLPLAFFFCWFCTFIAGCTAAPAPVVATEPVRRLGDDYVTRDQMVKLIRAALGDGDALADISLTAALAEGRDANTDDLIRRVRDAIETRAPRQPATTEQQLLATLTSIRAAIDISLDNLRNARTIGYQRRVVQMRHDAAGLDIFLSRTPGDHIPTDGDFDMAINGPGYFQVEVPDSLGGGIAYTRAGNFYMNSEGQLVLGSARSNVGRISLPGIDVPADATDIFISESGVIGGLVNGDSQPIEFGCIQLARFASPDGLRIDGGFLVETEASGPPILCDPNSDGCGSIRHKFLERANVDPVAELHQIIILRRWARTLAQAMELP